MPVGNALCDRKPKSRAALIARAHFVGAPESIEHTRKILAGDAEPCVAYFDNGLAAFRIQIDPDAAVLGRVLYGIVDKSHEQSANGEFISFNHRCVRWNARNDLDVLSFGQSLCLHGDIFDE